MSLNEIKLNIAYTSYGDSTISDILNNLLEESVLYQRSVGFFSSSVLSCNKKGIKKLIENGGKIELLCSPILNEDDSNTILLAYEEKKNRIKERFIQMFEDYCFNMEDDNLDLLFNLIVNNYLEIKVIKTKGVGIYHDKFGIFTDSNGNSVAFSGSANESQNGLKDNYEKIRMYNSWTDTNKYVVDEKEEFENLWNNKNIYNETYTFNDAIKESVIKIKQKRDNISYSKGIKLREYQKDAISTWKQNNYNGFFKMATGTGKTFTAIFACKDLKEEKNVQYFVILAPYKHLLAQWEMDVKRIFPESKTLIISAENTRWKNDIKLLIRLNNQTVFFISTIKSFLSENFWDVITHSNKNMCLVVDEAHRFKNSIEKLDENVVRNYFPYKIGLSATPPKNNYNSTKNDLIDFFGGIVYDLGLEEAISKGFLVGYNYFPIIVHLSDEETKKFKKYTNWIKSAFEDGRLTISKEELRKRLKARMSILSNAEEKLSKIDYILKQIPDKKHLIVYCGDAKNLTCDGYKEIQYLAYIKKKLDNYGVATSQFTCQENMNERMERIDNFNTGLIDCLVAIKCLDEGVNIPSIKNALILSSENDEKELVQRRGRILRKYEDEYGKKEFANIYDVIVLPSYKVSSVLKIELTRFQKYNLCSLNKESNEETLKKICKKYGFTLQDDIDNSNENKDEDLDDINMEEFDDD